MPMLTEDNFDFDEYSDSEVNSQEENITNEAHSKLVNDVQSITKKKGRKSAVGSVRYLSSGGTGVDLGHLTKNAVSVKHKEAAPSSKPQQRRVSRREAYAAASEEANRWEGVVNKLRRAEQVIFPLQDESVSIIQSEKEFKPLMETDIEKELYGLYEGSKLMKPKMETAQQKAEREAMSLEEVQERNTEAWRLRQLRDKIGKKAFLRNKTKSKKFHRILKKDKLKQATKNLEMLQKTNPEKALEEFKKLDAIRIEERMTLKHKKSRWAASLQLRAKTDKNALAALQENARLHSELRQKLKHAEENIEDSDSEVEEEEEEENTAEVEQCNNTDAPSVEGQRFAKTKEFWQAYNKEQEEKVKKQLEELNRKRKLAGLNKADAAIMEAEQIVATKLVENKKNTDDETVNNNHTEFIFSNIDKPEDGMHEVLKRRKTMEDFDNMPENSSNASSIKVTNKKELENVTNKEVKGMPEVDCNKFHTVTKDVRKSFNNSDDENDINDDHDMEDIFEEDSYALTEFKKERAAVDDANTPKDVCNFLPGWGSWAGPDIRPSKKLKDKFTDKAPAKRPSKFDKSNVIYNEKADLHDNIRNRMVSELPYPFRSVQDWEASLSGAVGRTFVPETVHRNMIAPAVVTKPGVVIKPMDETQLMQDPKIKKIVDKRMKKLKGGPKPDTGKESNKKEKLLDIGINKKKKISRKVLASK